MPDNVKIPENRRRILIVDDDKSIRDMLALILLGEGYEVAKASNGFDALEHMKNTLPDLVISDLNMPMMSGFELLSVVRRRFPEVMVVAMSGAYFSGDAVPGGMIADEFYPKGGSSFPDVLTRLVANLLSISARKKSNPGRTRVPVWVHRNGISSRDMAYIVLTCTDCLRSFPVDVGVEVTPAVMNTRCIYCPNEVPYIIDFSVPMTTPKESASSVVIKAIPMAGTR